MWEKFWPVGKRHEGLVLALVVSNVVSLVLLIVNSLGARSLDYPFLVWNLFLAWLPTLFATLLFLSLPERRWLSLRNVVLTLLWLIFLPNSFYLISDLVHLRLSTQQNVLIDVVMLASFIFNGLIAGMLSMYLVHRELYRRFWAIQTHFLMAAVILASSFAIYLGRNLRWNTWDVLLNPAALVFDVSDRFINPTSHPQAFSTTLAFFVLLGSSYIVVWQFARSMRRD